MQTKRPRSKSLMVSGTEMRNLLREYIVKHEKDHPIPRAKKFQAKNNDRPITGRSYLIEECDLPAADIDKILAGRAKWVPEELADRITSATESPEAWYDGRLHLVEVERTFGGRIIGIQNRHT